MDLRPTPTRIWITIAVTILAMLWDRTSLAAGDFGSVFIAGLAGAIVGYLAAPGLEYAWAVRNRAGDLDRIAILAAGGVAGVLGAVVYPWLTGRQVDHLTVTLLIVLAAGGAELLIRFRRSRQKSA